MTPTTFGHHTEAGRFITYFFVSLLLLATCTAIPIFGFLFVAGELVDVDDVVTHQMGEGGLYSSDLVNLEYQHRLNLLAARKPDIVALGSSRVGQAAPSYFERPFVNLTGMLRLPDDLQAIYADIRAAHAPEIIVVGLDHNWFHPDYAIAKGLRRNDRVDWEVSFNSLMRLAKLFVDGTLTAQDVLSVTRDDSPNLGIQAKLFGAGTDPFGVRDWGNVSYDGAIAEGVAQVALANPGFHYFRGSSLDEGRWSAYLGFLAAAEADGIRVIGYSTPLPPSVVAALETRGDIGWIETFRERVRALPNHYDFFDVRGLGAVDADFIDESHGGDRITEEIYSVIVRDNDL